MVKATRLSLKGHLALNVLWFSLNAQTSALLPIVIPTQIVLFISSSQIGSTQQVLFLSWLMIGAAIISLFMPPVVGMLSDRTPGSLGRRRPYILIGGLLLLASTPLLVNSGSIAIFLAGLALLLVGKNILTPAYQGLVPDRVPVEQRGEAAGYVGGMTILGNIVGLGLAALLLGKISTSTLANTALIRSNAGIYYIVTAILLFIGLVVTIFFVREKPLMKRTRELVIQKEMLLVRAAVRFVHDWMTPWRSYNFTMVFLARASLMLGLSLFMTYIEYYFARVQHASNFVAAAGIIAILALGGAVVSGVLSGILADRIRRRVPVVCMATLFMSAASLAFVLFPNNLMNWLWPLGVVFGLGYGAYSSVDWALSIDVLPCLDQAGKDMGVWNASATIPAIAAPLVGSLIINIAAGFGETALGYRLVFGAAAFFLLLAAFGILFVREGHRKQDTLTSRAA